MKVDYENVANVMNQISLMQTMATQFEDFNTVMSLVCKGISEIPGIENAEFNYVTNREKLDDDILNLEIKCRNYSFCHLRITFSDMNKSSHYLEILKNFSIVLGAIFGEKHQYKLRQTLLNNIEDTITYRTNELREEINKRELVETSLKDSKQKLDFALETSNGGLFEWRMQKNEMEFNDNYFIMAGYEPNEFPHAFEEWKKRVHPDDLPSVLKILDEFIDDEVNKYYVEFRFRRKDGSWMWILAQGRIFSFQNGKPDQFIGTHLDITEYKIIEQELREAREFLSNIINAMPSAIIGFDTNFKINQWNNVSEDYYNIKRVSAIEKNIFQLLPQLKEYKELFVKSLKEGLIESYEFKKKEHGKYTQSEECTIFPVMNSAIIGGVLRVDNTMEKLKLEELIIQNEKMLSVGGLAAGMAHEINNPLSGIMQNANVLLNRLLYSLDSEANKKSADSAGVTIEGIKKFMDNRRIPQLLNAMHQSGTQIADIVENMISFTSRTNEEMSLHKLDSIMDKTLLLLLSDKSASNRLSFDKIQINKNYEKSISSIPCDIGKIKQVLFNILNNAAQEFYINDIKNPEITIETFFDTNRNVGVLTVSDNGNGMKEEVAKRIFEPFFTTKEVDQGSGLGLSISFFIITENHNGNLYVETIEGKGSKFIIELPGVPKQ